jgi:RNA polymerase sigma-70 factor (ECF subfamily)
MCVVDGMSARVSGVLAVLFLVFNEGHLATGPGTGPVRHDLTAEAIRLIRLIRALMPDDGEVAGLLALMLLTEARCIARVSANGELVTLDKQDRGALGRGADRRGSPAGARAPGRGRRDQLGYRPRIPVETRCIAAAGVD